MHAVEDTGSHLQHSPLSFVEVLRPVISASTGPGRLNDAASAATDTPMHGPTAALATRCIVSGGRPEHQSGGIGRSDRQSMKVREEWRNRTNNSVCESSIVVVRTCKNATDTAELGGASRGYRHPHSHHVEAPSVEPLVAQPARPPTALSPTPT